MIENPAIVAGLVQALRQCAFESAVELEWRGQAPDRWDPHDALHQRLLWPLDERDVLHDLPPDVIAALLADVEAALARGEHH